MRRRGASDGEGGERVRRRGASDGEGERVCTEPGLAKEAICAENTPCTVQTQHKMYYQFFSALIYLMDHQSCLQESWAIKMLCTCDACACIVLGSFSYVLKLLQSPRNLIIVPYEELHMPCVLYIPCAYNFVWGGGGEM